ncbi:hypothetical protein B484DRAFT_438812, partial [Ochromonadaceae sp. CCMP2298]
ERQKYYERRGRAVENPLEYASFNSDGMNQYNSRIPHLSGLKDFERPLVQHIQGMLDHGGHEFVAYRSFHNVRKDRNLAIHCFLMQIERHMARHGGHIPETLYYQIDGGAENANEETLAICCLLVSRYNPNYKIDGIGLGIKQIIVTRLPPGHTHEDCDAQFGVIWRTTRRKPILTPNEYKIVVERCLSSESKNVEVVDIFAVPDYEAALKGCIDTDFAK